MSSNEFIKEISEASKWLAEQVFIHQSRVEYSKRMFAATLHIRTGDRIRVILTSGEEFYAKVLTVTPMIHPEDPSNVRLTYDLLKEDGTVIFNLDHEIQSIALIP